MPTSVIFENPEAGANIDDIMQWFEGLVRASLFHAGFILARDRRTHWMNTRTTATPPMNLPPLLDGLEYHACGLVLKNSFYFSGFGWSLRGSIA